MSQSDTAAPDRILRPAAPLATSARVRVWDPFVRLFHWGLAVAFAIAYLTEDELLDLHTLAGYTALGLVAARLVWGFVGPRHARFRDFVKGPGETLQYLRDELTGRAARFLGHNPAGAAMVVALMAGVLLTALTGMATLGAEHSQGPFASWFGGLSEGSAHALEEVHEFFANFTLLLVPLHLLGVAVASLMHRENLTRAMVDGFKRAAGGGDRV